MFCAPDTTFIDFSLYEATITINICNSFCDSFYSACNSLPLATDEINASNGKEFCQGIFDKFQSIEYSGGSSRKQHNSHKILQDYYYYYYNYYFYDYYYYDGGNDNSGAGDITLVISDSNCYAGVSSVEVGTSDCQPWPADQYKDGDGSNNNWYYFFFFFLALAAVAIVIIIIAIIVVVAFIVIRKRRSTVEYTGEDNNDIQ